MPDSPFDQLAEEAAAGLQGDDELFLDVKQELRGHLEDKADDLRGQGHSEEDSDVLARKAFGSPLAVAAELVAANAGRMRLRTLARLAFLLLVVPLAVALALYVGYDRFVGLSCMFSTLYNFGLATIKYLPILPGTKHIIEDYPGQTYIHKVPIVEQLASGFNHTANLRQYWEAHRQDSDAKMYYAYYALFASFSMQYVDMPVDAHYVAEMRRGEQIEPQNALYNFLLANYFLHMGMWAKSESARDEIKHRRAFILGIAELRKAAAKPYLYFYRANILQKKFNALPPPFLTEDYLERLQIDINEVCPEYAMSRNLARKIPGCARLLLAEGQRAEAEAVMDTWKPYTKLLVDKDSPSLISAVVASMVGEMLSKEGAEVYDRLGATAKAREARAIEAPLHHLLQDWRSSESAKTKEENLYREHGASLAIPYRALDLNHHVTDAELKPARMHEHTLIDEVLVECVVLLLIVALLVSLVVGGLWFFRLWKAGTRPMLLLPAGELCRAVLLGIALPVAVYWAYSRLPVIGGREYSWFAHWPRFAAEWLLLALLLLWLPGRHISRFLKRRCTELGMAPPSRVRRWLIHLRTWALMLIAVGIAIVPNRMGGDSDLCIIVGYLLMISPLLAVGYLYLQAKKWPLIPRVLLLVLAVILGEWAAYSGYPYTAALIWLLLAGEVALIGIYTHYRSISTHYRAKVADGRYHGTVALSLAPLFAFSALFLSLVVQPWLIGNEVYWLRRDTVFWNHPSQSVGIAALEDNTIAPYLETLDQVMKGR